MERPLSEVDKAARVGGDLDEVNAVTCDLCGTRFLSQSALLEHHKKTHMNEAEAEQAQMFRTLPKYLHAQPTHSPPQDGILAKLQSRLGLSVTPVVGPSTDGLVGKGFPYNSYCCVMRYLEM